MMLSYWNVMVMIAPQELLKIFIPGPVPGNISSTHFS